MVQSILGGNGCLTNRPIRRDLGENSNTEAQFKKKSPKKGSKMEEVGVTVCVRVRPLIARWFYFVIILDIDYRWLPFLFAVSGSLIVSLVACFSSNSV